jgi:hypothetical protein
MRTKRTFSTKEVLAAAPWVRRATLHWWIQEKLLPIRGRSQTRGVDNQFTEAEAVQAVVLDVLSTMGVLRDRQHFSVFLQGAKLHELVPDLSGTGPLGIEFSDLKVICEFYLAYDFQAMIAVHVEHRRHPPGRYFSVHYLGVDRGDPAVRELTSWQDRGGYGTNLALGFIDVKRVWEELNFGLGLALEP